ncbi:hypothetical protein BH10PAT3_BH10PAT3_0850 [soil metagenome]
MAKTVKVIHKGGPAGAFFLTIVGAAVYFVQQSHGFGEFLVALLKASVWPAFFIHKIFTLINL